ncbi:MAG TPA: GatB/YqeY domain-containing protein [Candidatus Eremiobacteraceae bacterium]|nr:GatB/YqeY domain-containing protein [Candidatus Eremiobacteraceae bacterium]
MRRASAGPESREDGADAVLVASRVSSQRRASIRRRDCCAGAANSRATGKGRHHTSTVDRLNADLKDAMKARDAERTSTLRLAISAMKYRTIERNAELSEEEQLDVLRKQVKQRDDSIEQFTRAGRADLAGKEERERAILSAYLPARLSGDALAGEVRALIATLPGDAKMGDAMKAAMAALKDRADGKAINQAVNAALAARRSS